MNNNITQTKRNEVVSNIIDWNGKVTLSGLSAKTKIRKTENIFDIVRLEKLRLRESGQIERYEKLIESFNIFKTFNKLA